MLGLSENDTILKKRCIYLISIYVSIYLLEEKFKLIANSNAFLALPVSGVVAVTPVSYTHLTLPTNREV